MKSVGTLLLLVGATFAYDAVIFSSTTKITKESPPLETLISSASVDSPLVFFVNPDFVLGQFSKAAATYSTQNSASSIVNAAKAAKFAESRFIPSAVHVSSPSLISSSSPLQSGQSIYLVSADNWSSLDKLASEVLAVVGDKATIVLTNSDVVSTDPIRVKRVAVGAATAEASLPVVIPAQDAKLPCLFYLEGLNFYTKGPDGKVVSARLRDDGTTSKKFTSEVPTCPSVIANKANGEQKASFQFTISPGTPAEKLDFGWDSMGSVSLKLNLVLDISGYWNLESAELVDDFQIQFTTGSVKKTISKTTALPSSVNYLGLNSVFSYSWNCWDTQALIFGDKTNYVGISLHGVQISIFGKDYDKSTAKSADTMSYFGSKVESCTGTFSASSWMGIVTSLVLLAVFFFGFLMLNSVQTGDRYDDPKQRQILINVRE